MMRRSFSWEVVIVDASDRVLKRLWEGHEVPAKAMFERVATEGLKRWPEGVEPLRVELVDPGRRVRRVEQLQRERTDAIAPVRTSKLQLEVAS